MLKNKDKDKIYLMDKKKPDSYESGFNNLRRRHTLPKVTSVPSAQLGLTSLFGMGRGGHQR